MANDAEINTPQSSQASVWLTSFEEVSSATESSLRRSLITSDGRGTKLKEACLNELLRRNHEH